MWVVYNPVTGQSKEEWRVATQIEAVELSRTLSEEDVIGLEFSIRHED